jgi:hypothetical protein
MSRGAHVLCTAAVLLVSAPASAPARCPENGPKAVAAAAMRTDILANCACCDLGSRRSVMRCVAPRLKAAVREGRLARACAGRLMREQRRLCRRTECSLDGTATTTTMPSGPCTRDEECEDGNGCTTTWCAAGTCAYACNRCALVHPNGGDTEWLCCVPPRDDCPPLPPTTTSTTLPPTCVPGECRYYRTCGWPVCPVDGHPVDAPPCTTQVEGAPCTERFERCDAGFDCGAVLLCTDHDPLAGSCPISRRDAKSDIRYLTNADLEHLRDVLLHLKLARWRYRTEGEGDPDRLGFIIDDLSTAGAGAASPAVTPDGLHVDLYGYASLAVAAIQAQAREIEALKREVAALRAKLATRR